MKRIFWISIFISCFTATWVRATNDSTATHILNLAHHSYQEEKYNLSIDYYTQLIESQYENADLFYNLGNAYYKNGELAHAILWYERALRLAPTDEDIKHNLTFVNQKITDKIEAIPQSFFERKWIETAHRATERQWAIISIVASALLIVSIMLFLFSKRSGIRLIAVIAQVILALQLILSILFARYEKQYLQSKDEAIIMGMVVEAKSEPNATSNTLFVVHEGLKVTLTNEVNGWVEIKLPNGERGWIQENVIEVI